jgi:glycosyltransferase involved in cell wall biosynthesis
VNWQWLPITRLYGEAAGLLFPSLVEGFGLPIVEAMACGTPVLTSSRGGCAEIAGGHATLVDPESIDAIAEGIDRLPATTGESRRDAARYASGFTWRRTAQQTLAVYRAARA